MSVPVAHGHTGARTIARRMLVTIALIAYGLVFSELFVRILAPQPLMSRYITGTPWGVRGNIPNARYWHHTPEVDVQYRINSQGLRADRDYPLRKPDGTCRIAIFGDSFLVGYELDLRDTFAVRLEQQLRARGYRVEVLNFSVSGFGTAEMLRTYTEFARKFDPDVVLFSWHLTDVDDNVRSGLYRLRDDGQLEDTHANYLPGIATQDYLMRFRLYRFVSDNSQLYALLRERIGLFLKRFVTQLRQMHPTSHPAPVAADAGSEDEEDAARAAQSQANDDLSSAVVARAAQTVTADGKDFYMLEIPTRITRVKFRSSIDVLSADVRSHINVISPLAVFAKAARPDRKIYYERGHGHYTPYGVNLVVDETVNTMSSSARLATCADGSGAPSKSTGSAGTLRP